MKLQYDGWIRSLRNTTSKRVGSSRMLLTSSVLILVGWAVNLKFSSMATGVMT